LEEGAGKTGECPSFRRVKRGGAPKGKKGEEKNHMVSENTDTGTFQDIREGGIC